MVTPIQVFTIAWVEAILGGCRLNPALPESPPQYLEHDGYHTHDERGLFHKELHSKLPRSQDAVACRGLILVSVSPRRGSEKKKTRQYRYALAAFRTIVLVYASKQHAHGIARTQQI